jgi:hypothetical protein
MSWDIILKKKKVNMNHLRKIVDHLLNEMPDEEFALQDFSKMVASTYKQYNPTQRSVVLASILGQMLKNRGYEKFLKYYPNGYQIIHYRKVD